MEKINLLYESYKVTAYHKQGKTNEKIVFLHGGSLDNALMSWKEVIDLMGDQYDIYAIDLLGYGESDKPDIVYSIPMYVEFLHDMLKELKIEKTHLVGLSMGGGINIGFSLKYPEMVDKLIIADPIGFCEKMPFHKLCHWYVNSWLNAKSYEWTSKSKKLIRWSMESTFIGDKKKVTDDLINMLYDMLKDSDCGRAWMSFQRYELGSDRMTTDLMPHLGELKMPVLIVNGEKDSLVTLKSADAACKIIENSKLHIMKGCKHWCQKERPEEFADVLKEFLTGEYSEEAAAV